ncbi:MAG: hypothetical protein HQK79_18530 [Desulfobacterales bacterium]|nr:hypothetical protein [Desulfobacterales bacterium]MBF0396847.1 hypothetical protein [Desulfobacterales bacterium]
MCYNRVSEGVNRLNRHLDQKAGIDQYEKDIKGLSKDVNKLYNKEMQAFKGNMKAFDAAGKKLDAYVGAFSKGLDKALGFPGEDAEVDELFKQIHDEVKLEKKYANSQDTAEWLKKLNSEALAPPTNKILPRQENKVPQKPEIKVQAQPQKSIEKLKDDIKIYQEALKQKADRPIIKGKDIGRNTIEQALAKSQKELGGNLKNEITRLEKNIKEMKDALTQKQEKPEIRGRNFDRSAIKDIIAKTEEKVKSLTSQLNNLNKLADAHAKFEHITDIQHSQQELLSKKRDFDNCGTKITKLQSEIRTLQRESTKSHPEIGGKHYDKNTVKTLLAKKKEELESVTNERKRLDEEMKKIMQQIERR